MSHSVLYAVKRATMPRLSKTKALEAALERLQAVREDFAQAFEGILSQIDLRPIAQALADWRQAAEALKEEVQTVHDDASAYVDERSDKWQESDKGQVCNMWVTALEELADFDPVPLDTIRIALDLSGEVRVADMESDPSEALPELPEMLE